ncbi:hypothetical protein [Rhizorhabdus histidinilytica]|jgi:hypothetical protein
MKQSGQGHIKVVDFARSQLDYRGRDAVYPIRAAFICADGYR